MLRFVCRDVNWADFAPEGRGAPQVFYHTFMPDEIEAMEKFLRSTSQYNNRELIGCELIEAKP